MHACTHTRTHRLTHRWQVFNAEGLGGLWIPTTSPGRTAVAAPPQKEVLARTVRASALVVAMYACISIYLSTDAHTHKHTHSHLFMYVLYLFETRMASKPGMHVRMPASHVL